jgi:four helix bundle protein
VAQVIGKQLLRSATSVGANFREAQRARSRTEFVAKLNLSLMELEESLYWIELLSESNAAGSQVNGLVSLQSETIELCAIFVTVIKRARQSIGGKSAEVGV